ncbi:hypothetical protein KJ762_05870 [bacterium]|nr:hypothetical protein [bacterium]MBU1065601.1 hypothetical protein [bacterium]MBU1634022.1 hypothetical protein [bacterium]MBU1873449.1 hypothetical protein [bacterium]
MEFSRNIYFFLYRNRRIITTWLIIIVAITLGLYLNIDKDIIAVSVVIFGIIANAFAGIAGIIAMVPFVGPLIIKVLSLPVFWLLNAMGYYISVIAIKKGYGRDVVSYRMVTVIFLVGFAVGFIIAKLL